MTIVITSSGGGEDGADLVGFFFELVPGSTTEYNLCDPNGTPVMTAPSPFTNRQKFTFQLDGWTWEIKDFDLLADPPGGKWKNTHPENGTFTGEEGMEGEAKGKTA